MNARGVVLVASLWLGLAMPASAVAAEDADRACARLVEAAQARELAGAGQRGDYLCQRQDEASARFVFALRWRGDGLPATGSNLVGYYLVDAASGDIHAWDLGEDRRGEALAASPADAPRELSACGIAFELARPLRITTPEYRVTDQGVAVCAFDIVPRTPLAQDECKDADEGGSPPYDRCDWRLDGGADYPSVQVARMRLHDHQPLPPFDFDGGQWTLPNAQAGDQPATATRMLGHSAWEGEIVTRLYWWRTQTRDYQGIYGGSGSVRAILVQLAPETVVALAGPPTDEQGDCTRFRTSLRLLPAFPRTDRKP